MKILNILIPLLAAIQLVLIKPLAAAPPDNTSLTTHKAHLRHFYEKELSDLFLKYCIHIKNIFSQIQKNETIQQSTTPVMQQFKANITQFEEMYTLYTRLGLNKELLTNVTENIRAYYDQYNDDSKNVLRLLRSLGYNEMLNKFKTDYIRFALTKFLPKFGEFKKLIPNTETKEWQNLLSWGDNFEECMAYACFYFAFVDFDSIILTAKEHLFAHINQKFSEINLFYINGSHHVVQGVLKRANQTQLSREVRQALRQNLQQFMQLYESSSTMAKFNEMLEFYRRQVLAEFLDNNHIPAKDAQLLKEIFHLQGSAQVELNYENKLQKFLDSDLLKEFERYEAQLSEGERVKEEPLIKLINRLKNSSSFEERRYTLIKIWNSAYGV